MIQPNKFAGLYAPFLLGTSMDYKNKIYELVVLMKKIGMHVELWKKIEEFPEYEVSTEGRVRNTATQTIIGNRPAKKAPNIVYSDLFRHNKKYKRNLAKLVLSAFSNEPLSAFKIKHEDNDNKNNRLCNLVYESKEDYSLVDFKQIPQHQHHFINKNGIVYNAKTKSILKPHLTGKGYYFVAIAENGKKQTGLIHKLLALTYIPNPNNYPQINHINGIKTDNRLENLEWCTALENNLHALKTQLRTGTKKIKKLSNTDVLTIKQLHQQGYSFSEISKKFSVSVSTVHKVIHDEY